MYPTRRDRRVYVDLGAQNGVFDPSAPAGSPVVRSEVHVSGDNWVEEPDEGVVTVALSAMVPLQALVYPAIDVETHVAGLV